jgi:hypothetical protein
MKSFNPKQYPNNKKAKKIQKPSVEATEATEVAVTAVEPVIETTYTKKPSNVPEAVSEAKNWVGFIDRYRKADDHGKRDVRAYLGLEETATEKEIIYAYIATQ